MGTHRLLLVMSVIILVAAHVHAQEIDLEDQQILYLPMNGHANDESGQEVPTFVGGPVLTADRHGNPDAAYLFDGVDDTINLNNNIALITQKEFSICMWARIDGPSLSSFDNNTLFEQRDDRKDDPVVIQFTADRDDLTLFGIRCDSHPVYHTTSAPFPGYGSWHHFAAVIDKEKNKYVFIDGKMVAHNVFHSDGEYTRRVNHVNIGAHHPESMINGAFNGAIDEVRIYNRALNFCEIEALFSGQLLEER